MTEQDYRAGQNAVLDELAKLLGCSMTTWSCCKKRIEELLEAEERLEDIRERGRDE